MRKSSPLVFLAPAIALLALVFTPFVLGNPPAQDRIPDGIDNARRVAMHGNVHRLARPEFDEGPMPRSTVLEHMQLVFAPSAAQQQELNALLAAQQDRNSPLYHQWLTPEEYGARFGLSDSDLAKVQDWLKHQGFSITEVGRGRNFIAFEGTVAQAQAAFTTQIDRYVVNDKEHFANATEPTVPAALAGLVGSIRGLHNFHPHAHAVRPRFTSYVSGNHFIAPDDFATIYDLKPLYQQGIDGTGQSIAVVGQTDIQQGDIDTFRSISGLPPTKLQVTNIATGYVAGINNDDLTESDLDIEWAGAVAPNAQIIFVTSGGGKNNGGAFAAFQFAVDQKVAPVVSVSYGECEAQAGSDAAFLSQLAQRATSQGQTVVAASGDSGAADCDPPTSNSTETLATLGLSVDLPAGTPFVTGVGGTQFNDSAANWSAGNNSFQGSALGYIPELGWNTTAADNTMAASGGGTSAVFTSANPQKIASFSATDLAFQTGVTPNGGTARDVPDISLAANVDHDGLVICSAGSCTNGFRKADTTLNIVGGTSAGTPSFAAMVALLNQMENSTGQGNLNPALYKLAGSSGFHDITTGDNKIPCKAGTTGCGTSTTGCPVFVAPPSGVSATNPCYGFSAGPGYDLVTGLGSIDAYNLLTELKNGNSTTPPAPADFQITGAPSVLPLPLGGTASFTATFSGAASPINVSCFVGGGANATTVNGMTCTPSVTTASSGTQVTFTVKAASQVSSARPAQQRSAPWSLAWTALAGSVLWGGAAANAAHKRKKNWARFLLVLALGSVIVLISCGGGSSSSTNTTAQASTSGPAVSSVTLSPNAVIGTNSASGTVTLASAAPSSGTTVALTSSSAAATVPSTVTVQAGATTANFTVTTKSVTTPTAATITAMADGGSQTATLNVANVVVVVQGSVGPNNGTAFGSNVHTSAVPVAFQ